MRLEALTFTRFIAALMIVIYHFGNNIYPFNVLIFKKLFLENADVAVSYFFVLSGFVMVIAYNKLQKTDFRKFYMNRLARIAPNYFLAMFIFMIFADVIGGKELFLNLLGLQSWVPSFALSMNFPDWTISVELFFYIIFPFLIIYFRSFSTKKIIINTIILWMFMQCLFLVITKNEITTISPSIAHDFWYRHPIIHLNSFILGMFAGLIFLKSLMINAKKFMKSDLFIILITCLILIFNLLPIPSFNYYIPKMNYHNGFLALFFIPLIWGLSLNEGFISKLFQNKFMIFLGEISYGLYIFQYPLHLCLKKSFPLFFEQSKNLFFFTYLAILIIFSMLIFKFFEIPCREKIRKLRIPN